MLASAQGYAKRTDVDEFPIQTRGGAGLKAAKIDKARGPLVAVATAADEVAFLTADGCLVMPGHGVRAAGRDGGGSKTSPVGLQRVVAVVSRREEG